MSPQCVSCNNQPNENDSLGGAASEGTVTPVVIGIIVGTVAVFILVLCALFYCVKLENERSLRVKDDDGDDEGPPHTPPGDGPSVTVTVVDDGNDNNDNMNNNREDYRRVRITPAARFGRGRRRSSSAIAHVVAGQEQRLPRAEVMTGAVVGKKRGLFGWGGGKKGGSAPSDNSPVTAIEMV